MPRVGFELTISVFERTKTVHVLDRAVTVISCYFITHFLIYKFLNQLSERALSSWT
jgi:hypothetical protein